MTNGKSVSVPGDCRVALLLAMTNEGGLYTLWGYIYGKPFGEKLSRESMQKSENKLIFQNVQ